jgi:hypothetical protein
MLNALGESTYIRTQNNLDSRIGIERQFRLRKRLLPYRVSTRWTARVRAANVTAEDIGLNMNFCCTPAAFGWTASSRLSQDTQ